MKLTDAELEAIQSLPRETPYQIHGVSQTQLSIARHFGVCRFNGAEYTDYEPPPKIQPPKICPECAGTGEVRGDYCGHPLCRDGELFHPRWVGTALFDVRYLHRISKLPNVRIRVVGPVEPAAFVFDGGEGRLMPCRGL